MKNEKALTICQPYAHMIIVTQEKRVENRSWYTHYRGPLLIHAGKGKKWLDGDEDELYADDPMVFGAIIGRVQLVDVLHIDQIRKGTHDDKYPWLRNHEHAFGPWCWILSNVERFDAIPINGAQGLWNYMGRT